MTIVLSVATLTHAQLVFAATTSISSKLVYHTVGTSWNANRNLLTTPIKVGMAADNKHGVVYWNDGNTLVSCKSAALMVGNPALTQTPLVWNGGDFFEITELGYDWRRHRLLALGYHTTNYSVLHHGFFQIDTTTGVVNQITTLAFRYRGFDFDDATGKAYVGSSHSLKFIDIYQINPYTGATNLVFTYDTAFSGGEAQPAGIGVRQGILAFTYRLLGVSDRYMLVNLASQQTLETYSYSSGSDHPPFTLTWMAPVLRSMPGFHP